MRVPQSGLPYYDASEGPWSSMPKRHINTTNKILCDEIVCCWNAYHWAVQFPNMTVPRPASWKTDDLHNWLNEYSIATLDKHEVYGGAKDMVFVYDEMEVHKLLFLKAIEEKEAEEVVMEREEKWAGHYPYLCLIHCLVDFDNIKDKFLHRHDLNEGQGPVDSRHSEDCHQKSVWELIANKWNGKNYEPATEVIAEKNGFYTSPYGGRDPLVIQNCAANEQSYSS